MHYHNSVKLRRATAAVESKGNCRHDEAANSAYGRVNTGDIKDKDLIHEVYLLLGGYATAKKVVDKKSEEVVESIEK